MKIALGTAQFGLDYGISNIHGITKKHEIDQILQFASENDIRIIDTAKLYGNSESVIGDFNNCNYDWSIVTKTPHFTGDHIGMEHVNQLKNSFSKSLLNLKKKSIYGLLLHSCDDLLKPNGSMLFEAMKELKKSGLVKKIGVSLYSGKQIDYILSKFDIDLVQLPINIFDQKLFLSGQLKKLKNNGVEVHARSAFLQGLLLMDYDLIPSYFLPIIKKIDLFHALAKNMSLSRLELALGFVLGIDEIDKIVIGVNTVSQLQEIIKATQVNVNALDFRSISVDNTNFTNPSLCKI